MPRFITTQWEQGVKNRYAGDSAIGHHWLKWMVGPILAQKYGLQYVYKPFLEYENSPSWDKFLGFGNCVSSKLNTRGVPFYDIKDIPQNIKTIDLPKLPWDCKWNNPVFQKTIGNNYEFDVFFKIAQGQAIAFDWSYYLNNDLREKYDFARQKNPVGSNHYPNFINMACHIRRGDIDKQNCPERWISNEQYANLFKNIINTLKDDCLIHVYSEGKVSDFYEIEKLGSQIVFHLDESPYVTFHNMIIADILINAKSAFSVMAAYLNKGIKLCIPFSVYWHDFPDWPELIAINNNFDFDNKKLIKALENKK